MKLLVIFLSVLVVSCTALPYSDYRNMVTVPPNCPVGQVWVNGQCRDIWRLKNFADIYLVPAYDLRDQDYSEDRNVITVPPNCPVGQEWVNGQCREIWRLNKPGNSYPGPKLELQDHDYSEFKNSLLLGKLAKQYENDDNTEIRTNSLGQDRRVINVPNQCPAGQRPDALGICRPILD